MDNLWRWRWWWVITQLLYFEGTREEQVLPSWNRSSCYLHLERIINHLYKLKKGEKLTKKSFWQDCRVENRRYSFAKEGFHPCTQRTQQRLALEAGCSTEGFRSRQNTFSDSSLVAWKSWSSFDLADLIKVSLILANMILTTKIAAERTRFFDKS